MCILLKFDFGKFGVSNIYFSKVIEEKPLGLDSIPLPPPPPLVKEGLKAYKLLLDDLQVFCNETIFQIFHAGFSWIIY